MSWTPPSGVREFLRIIDQNEDRPFLIVFRAPTGYGKSRAVMEIARTILGSSRLFSRLIHVLPMRAVVEDLFTTARKEVQNVSVGAQAMHLLDASKSPYFLYRLVYTTLDSFVQNLFKVPVAEPERDYSHFDVPRHAIYTSLTVFDEAHIYAPDVSRESGDESKAITSLLASIFCLTEAQVPVILMSATLSNALLKHILTFAPHANKVIVDILPSSTTHRRPDAGVEYVPVVDGSFFSPPKRTIPQVICEEELLSRVRDFVNQGCDVLIVRNTVRRVLETFDALRNQHLNCDLYLLHSRMTTNDRNTILNTIKEKLLTAGHKPQVLVSTQVIEVGVNLDFDVLITDKCPLNSFIQRAGRIHRGMKEAKGVKRVCDEPDVCIVDIDPVVYDYDLTDRSLKVVQRGIDLKDPFDQLEAVYDESYIEEFCQVNSDLFLALREIDLIYEVSTYSVRPLLQHLCSFVRTDGLVSFAYIPDVYENWTQDDTWEYTRCLVPLTVRFLRKCVESGVFDDLLYNIERRVNRRVVKEAAVLCLGGASSYAGEARGGSCEHDRRAFYLEWVPMDEIRNAFSAREPCACISRVNSILGKMKQRRRKEGRICIPIAFTLNPEAYQPNQGVMVRP